MRRELFDRIGVFAPEAQLAKGDIGSMDDHEFIIRLWHGGVIGLYVPELVVHAPVEAERMTKNYHRRWHKGHGRNYAIVKEERLEKASWYLYGVPAHMYRQALMDTVGLMKNSFFGREEDTFLCEIHLWFFVAFSARRVRDLSFPSFPLSTRATRSN